MAPGLVRGLDGFKIVRVAAGEDNSLAMTDEGDIFGYVPPSDLLGLFRCWLVMDPCIDVVMPPGACIVMGKQMGRWRERSAVPTIVILLPERGHRPRPAQVLEVHVDGGG
jgi:hypothetical protein